MKTKIFIKAAAKGCMEKMSGTADQYFFRR
jgi:hypothetical protein